MKLQKGDLVKMISGRDKGKSGKILAVFPKESKIVVEGINKVKRHKKGRNGATSGIFEKEHAFWASKAMLLDPEKKQPTRVGYKLDAGGKKYRISKLTGNILKK